MTLESSKTLGGVGSLLMVISPLTGYVGGGFGGLLGLVGLILVLISVKGLADYYNDGSIFNNTLYGVIFTIIGGVASFAAVIVGGVGLLSALNLDISTIGSDPSAISAIDWDGALDFELLMNFITIILVAAVILFALLVISAIFYRKSLNTLSEKTGVELFGTTGMLILIGAILTIIVIGALILWVALILLTVAFFSIKPEPATVVSPPPPTET
ncbi:MAG: DUF996 domain-containing protein [Candidatus Bathyarchaeota archaeon]|nr:DUF996 domain-containing protein [Candidatus Bathyarchaeum tardum]WGM89947.1 MAG: DUF996 domain-containing protein [Candidatus Bathyarchaeum tardum]